jgi:hypothetical protein
MAKKNTAMRPFTTASCTVFTSSTRRRCQLDGDVNNVKYEEEEAADHVNAAATPAASPIAALYS